MSLRVSSIVELSMNIITLWISVSVDYWTVIGRNKKLSVGLTADSIFGLYVCDVCPQF